MSTNLAANWSENADEFTIISEGGEETGTHAHASETNSNSSTKAEEKAQGILESALLTTAQLMALNVPPRASLAGDWFQADDYGIICGRRGIGKSWLAMELAIAMVEGRDFGPWKCPKPIRGLYVDGEMALDHSRDRVRALSANTAGGGALFVLSHQQVFNTTQKALCLSDPAQQNELIDICEREKIDVVFLDNGACLFRGVDENSADDFRDKIEGWLLAFRRRGIAVVLVLHEGRNGAIRGTSKREDATFWILRVAETGSNEHTPGARFISCFTKNRNAQQDPPFRWNGTSNRMATKRSLPIKKPIQWRFSGNGLRTG